MNLTWDESEDCYLGARPTWILPDHVSLALKITFSSRPSLTSNKPVKMSNMEPEKPAPKMLRVVGLQVIYDDNEVITDADEHVDSRNQFGRQPSNPRSNQNQPPNRANTSSPSAYSPSSLGPPSMLPTPSSPSLSTTTMQINEHAHQSNQAGKKPPFFFRDDYAGFIVKGNFGTLSIKPQLVDDGEWVAHQGQSYRK